MGDARSTRDWKVRVSSKSTRESAAPAELYPAEERAYSLFLPALDEVWYGMPSRCKDMLFLCLRQPQTPARWNVLQTLNAGLRFYSTKPKLPQLAADTRELNNRHAPKLDIERSTRGRSWLRAILRECMYLPDPKARKYVAQHAISRFGRYSFGTRKNSKKPIPGLEGRLRAKEKEARRAVNLLKRANEGELKPLLRVLFMTYGRIGKRRHELMEPLMSKPIGDNDTAVMDRRYSVTGLDKSGTDFKNTLDKGIENRNASSTFTSTDITQNLPQALYQLLQSQQQVEPPDRTRSNPRKLQPDIPALNSKMRSMPASRVKNLTKKWYADLLDRVLPPLPADEWHHLRGLANGLDLPKQPSRRKAPRDMESVADHDKSPLEMVLTRGSGGIDSRVFGNREAHTITPRLMQRLYAIVFRQCPLMEFDAQANKWTVRWGKYELQSGHGIAPANRPPRSVSSATTLPK